MTFASYLSRFEGHQDCGITSKDLYTPPIPPDAHAPKHTLFCSNRAKLLDALSGGGRHGFEAPFFSKGCHYRWYSTPEICMILERFDAVVFIGDDMVKHIYTAFNMLLRENIATGGLKQWELTGSERDACRCENQIVKPDCATHTITENSALRETDGSGHKSPYYCDRSCSMTRTSSLITDGHRYSASASAYCGLTSARRETRQVQFPSHGRSRLIQADRSCPLSIVGNLIVMVCSDGFNGRMGQSSRCVRKECSISLAGS